MLVDFNRISPTRALAFSACQIVPGKKESLTGFYPATSSTSIITRPINTINIEAPGRR